MNFNVARASSGVARKILQPTNYATCSAAAAKSRIDTWQIVYLLYEDACPIIAIHIN